MGLSHNETHFWQTKPLYEMSHNEWESVCDGCAKCCRVQLQDEETDKLVWTEVVCNLLDASTCQCTNYAQRSDKVPSCMTLNKDNVSECAEFAPETCAYRLLLQNQPLPEWHHLLCGDRQQVHDSGQSVQNKVRLLRDIEMQDIEYYVVDK